MEFKKLTKKEIRKKLFTEDTDHDSEIAQSLSIEPAQDIPFAVNIRFSGYFTAKNISWLMCLCYSLLLMATENKYEFELVTEFEFEVDENNLVYVGAMYGLE